MSPGPHEQDGAPVSGAPSGAGDANLPARLPARELVHPATGELLDLDSPTTDLAGWRLEMTDLKRALDAVLVDMDAEITRRLDAENVRSARVGDYEVKTEAPTVVEWDEPTLSVALEALVTDGRIARGAAERALGRQVVLKPHPVELKKLLGHADSEVRRSVEGCRAERPRDRRRVTVTIHHN